MKIVFLAVLLFSLLESNNSKIYVYGDISSSSSTHQLCLIGMTQKTFHISNDYPFPEWVSHRTKSSIVDDFHVTSINSLLQHNVGSGNHDSRCFSLQTDLFDIVENYGRKIQVYMNISRHSLAYFQNSIPNFYLAKVDLSSMSMATNILDHCIASVETDSLMASCNIHVKSSGLYSILLVPNSTAISYIPNNIYNRKLQSLRTSELKTITDKDTFETFEFEGDKSDPVVIEVAHPARTATGGIIHTVMLFLTAVAFIGNALFMVYVFWIANLYSWLATTKLAQKLDIWTHWHDLDVHNCSLSYIPDLHPVSCFNQVRARSTDVLLSSTPDLINVRKMRINLLPPSAFCFSRHPHFGHLTELLKT
eukprot:gene5800-11704_t